MSMWLSHIPNLEVISVLPVLCGREEDGGNGEPAGTGGAGSGEPKPEGDKPEGASDKSDDGSQGDPQKKIAAQDEIIERLSQQRKEKDEKLQELLKYKEDAENAKLSDQQKIDKRIKELEESDAAKSETLQKLVVNNAFLAANDVTWHDPETALSLLDTSDLEFVVDEKTGVPTVKDKKAFAKAIAKLAEDKPYLVKTQPAEDDPKPGPKAWNGKTGDSPKPKASEEANERRRLQEKYPALRGR